MVADFSCSNMGHNPARHLYARLGFVQVEEGPIYDRLEWRPGEVAS